MYLGVRGIGLDFGSDPKVFLSYPLLRVMSVTFSKYSFPRPVKGRIIFIDITRQT